MQTALTIAALVTLNNNPTPLPSSLPKEVGRPIVKIRQIKAHKPLKLKKVEKLPRIQPKARTAPVRGSVGGNVYEYRSCTWWVKTWKPSIPNDWHNANTWDDYALAAGWTVSTTPIVGAVAQTDAGTWGHVAFVTAVNEDTVTIREGNYDWNGSVRTATVPTSQYKYIY